MTYAILTDITPNHADVAWLGTDREELFEELEHYGDNCDVYEAPADARARDWIGARVRLSMLGERVSLADL
jgi:hypothetical protein